MKNEAHCTTLRRNGCHQGFKVTAFLAVYASLLTFGVQADLPIGDLYVDAATGNDLDDGRSWATAKASIQAAIDVATEDNLILVNDGRYTPIDSANKRIEIRSVNGAETTVIDASLQWALGITNRCATLGSSSYQTSTILSGFCLTNGIADNGGGSCYGTLNNCILSGNTATQGGGSSYGRLNNCTLSGNTATQGGGSSYGRLNNCTLSGNTATYGGGAYSGTLINCIVWGNTARLTYAVNGSTCQYSCLDAGVAGNGNIFTDPLFVDAANGDFRLQPDSPCIDAGLNGSAVGNTDSAGNVRIFGDAVDMGAYEFVFDPSTILLVSRDGSGTTVSVTPAYGAPMPPITPPVRLGYDFGGYWTEPNGGGTQYYTAAGESARDWDRSTPAMLYAQWIVKTCAITLDAKGGSGGTAFVTATYGTAMPQITPPVRDGLAFGGYWTKPNGGGMQYYTAAGSSAQNWTRVSSSEETLYAKWTVIGPSVTFRGPEISVDGRSFIASSTTSGPTIEYGGRPEMDVFVELCNGACNIRVDVEAVPIDDAGNPAEGAIATTVAMNGDGNAGGSFRVWMPALSAGRTGYRFVATGDVADAVLGTSPAVGYYVYATDAVLDSQREPDFAALLPHQSSQTCTQDTTYWHFGNVLVDSFLVNSIGFDSRDDAPILASRLAFDGIGRIYFKAHSQMLDGPSSTLPGIAVEMSHDGSNWETLNIVEIPQGATEADDTQFCIAVYDYDQHYVRFVPDSHGTNPTCGIFLRDVIVTPPPSTVEVWMPSIIHPGYPSQNDDITFRATVRNFYDGYPAMNIRPVLRWRRVFGSVPQPWVAAPMTSHDGATFACTLPAMAPGRLEYYVETHFDGASYDYTASGKYDADRPLRLYCAYDDLPMDQDPLHFRECGSPTYMFPAENSPDEFSIASQQRSLVAPDVYDSYFWFTVRPYESRYRELRFVFTDALEAAGEGVEFPVHTNAFRLVGDNVWMGTVPVPASGAVLSGLLYGLDFYEEGADVYASSTDSWGGSVSGPPAEPPFDGVVTADSTTPIAISVPTNSPPFVAIRFDADSGAYQIRRAAYQDFNDWGADTQYFEDSTGLYDVLTYEQTFDGSTFPETSMNPRVMTFDNDTVGDYTEDDYLTTLGWSLYAGEILRERKPRLPEDKYDLVGNVAACLHQGGYLCNEAGIGGNSEGLDYVTLRSRVSYGADGNTPYDRTGFAWENYLLVVSNVLVSAISDGEPWIQVMAAYAGPYDYVALRLKQTATITPQKGYIPRVKQEMVRVVNGVESVLGWTYTQKWNNGRGYPNTQNENDKLNALLELTKADWCFEIDMTTEGYVKARAWIPYITSPSNFLSCAASTMGTISCDTFDARANFRNFYVVQNGTSRPVDTANWYLCGQQPGNPAQTRWIQEMPYGRTSQYQGIARPIPSLSYAIGIAEAGESAMRPATAAYNSGAEFTADSFSYATATKSVHYWGNAFVRIKPGKSDASLVVDDIEVQSWRGRSLPEDAPTDDRYWQAREAVIATRNGTRVLALTTSRANPDNRQMVSTPEMLDGIGTISFNYEVVGGRVTFVVESNAFPSDYGDNAVYTTVDTFSAVNGEKGEVYRVIRSDMTGKIRIRVLQEQSDEEATLCLDNFFAKSFPPDDGRSWTAYNALIVAPTRNEMTDAKQFEEDVSTQTAFLNNSVDGDTRQNTAYLEHLPYIQSPIIDTGIGEIGFWYRIWNPADPTPGQITLWVAENGDDPDRLWRQITVNDLTKPETEYSETDSAWVGYNEKVAAFQALSNITNGAYRYFSVEICDLTNHVLRICSDTNGTQRVAIDNVIVMEPLGTSPVAVDHTVTTPVPVPYSYLDIDCPALVAAHGGDYEAAANAIASNGVNKVWECYVAGISPTNEIETFQVIISMDADGKPVISWAPPLPAAKAAKREYRILGAETPDAPEPWDDVTNVPDLDAAGYRFFKVKVRMKE